MKNDPPRVKNPAAMLMMHGLVILLVLYMFWSLLKDYLAGGAGAPTLATVIVGGILLIGGCGIVGYLAIRIYRQERQREQEDSKEIDVVDHAEGE